MKPLSLRRWINALGTILFVAHLTLTVLSYFQAAVLWKATEFPNASAFFESLGAQSTAVTASPATWLAASRLLDGNEAALLSQAIPFAIASIAAVLVMLLLTRHVGEADRNLAGLLFRWSIAFAAACFFAFPLFTQDFWLSAAWGRMAAVGANPFHALFTANDLTGLPLDHFPMTMSYGPLWAVVSALIALVAWNHALVMGLLFKGVIAAAWIWSLALIDQFMRDKPIHDRCLAIALFGWVPLGVSQSISEGHNDIVMMAPALLWLLLLVRNNAGAPIALAVSVLCKYVTAPLFLIDLIDAFRRQRLGVLGYVRRMLLPALVGILSAALFFRSISFFDGVLLVSEWHFLRPSEAVSGLQELLGAPLYPLHVIALAVFPVHAVYRLAAAVREPTAGNLTAATVALMAAIMFGAISHLWPWYLVWGVAFGALLPRWWVSRFITGVALLIPFALPTWWIPALEPQQNIAALAIYAGAGLWVYLTRERPAAGDR